MPPQEVRNFATKIYTCIITGPARHDSKPIENHQPSALSPVTTGTDLKRNNTALLYSLVAFTQVDTQATALQQ